MTDDGPDLDLLADLDAGILDADRAAEVRAAALADPRSAAILAALAATRAELAGLPAPAVPVHVAGRWAAALEAEAGHGPVGEQTTSSATSDRTNRAAGSDRPDIHRSDPAPGRDRPPPSRRHRPRPALVAAAVLAVLVAAGVLWARPDRLPSLDRVDLAAAGRAAVGTTDVGRLADPARRAGCLQAVAPPGVRPDAPLLGGRRVQVDGGAAVLLVLATGELGTFHAVVVDPACGPEGGTLLGSDVVGR
jgi:hypothetical protein